MCNTVSSGAGSPIGIISWGLVFNYMIGLVFSLGLLLAFSVPYTLNSSTVFLSSLINIAHLSRQNRPSVLSTSLSGVTMESKLSINTALAVFPVILGAEMSS